MRLFKVSWRGRVDCRKALTAGGLGVISHPLAPVSHVKVGAGVVLETFTLVLGFSLSAGGREEAFFAFAAAADARWIVRVVDGAQIAADLAATAWDTGLVCTSMLLLRRRLWRRGGLWGYGGRSRHFIAAMMERAGIVGTGQKIEPSSVEVAELGHFAATTTTRVPAAQHTSSNCFPHERWRC